MVWRRFYIEDEDGDACEFLFCDALCPCNSGLTCLICKCYTCDIKTLNEKWFFKKIEAICFYFSL